MGLKPTAKFKSGRFRRLSQLSPQDLDFDNDQWSLTRIPWSLKNS